MNTHLHAIAATILFTLSLAASSDINLATVTSKTLDALYTTMETTGNAQTIDGIIKSYKNTITSLVRTGKDIDQPLNEAGQTALMVVARYQHSELVKILLDGGAQATKQDIHGHSALTYALISRIQINTYGGIQALIASGYDPENHKKTVRYLLEAMNKNEQAASVTHIVLQFIKPQLSQIFSFSKEQLQATKTMVLKNFEQTTKNNKKPNLTQVQLAKILELAEDSRRIDAALSACLNFLAVLKEQGIVDDIAVIKRGLNSTQQFFSDLHTTRKNIKQTEVFISEQIQKGTVYLKDIIEWSFDAFDEISTKSDKQKKLEMCITDFAAQLFLNYYLEDKN